MRLKIADKWYGIEDGPIMVEFTKRDLENVRNMHPDATKYAIFDEDSGMSLDEKKAWME